MSAGINTKPPIGALRFTPRPRDHEEIPIGSTVRTPMGLLAVVEGYRGFRRDHRVRLICRYIKPRNRAFAVAILLPELVEVVHAGR